MGDLNNDAYFQNQLEAAMSATVVPEYPHSELVRRAEQWLEGIMMEDEEDVDAVLKKKCEDYLEWADAEGISGVYLSIAVLLDIP